MKPWPDACKASFEELGNLMLKNIERPVQTFAVQWQAMDWRHAHEAVATAAPAGARRGAGCLALPDKPSIAVLPFDNMSADPEQEHFADGVVELITAALSRIRAFFVIARNSAFAYKGHPTNVREIGRELGVAYVLEGSVQRVGARVRITAQLIETAGGAHLWADRYDGSLDDIFDLQDRITEAVAGALQPSIRLAEIERSRRKRPQELGAYDYAMRAMQHAWLLEEDAAARALELLGKALEIDPDYPLALALTAWCWAQRSVYNWADDAAAAKAEALKLADRAAEPVRRRPADPGRARHRAHLRAQLWGGAGHARARRRPRSQRRLGAEPAGLARRLCRPARRGEGPFREGDEAEPARSDQLQQSGRAGQRAGRSPATMPLPRICSSARCRSGPTPCGSTAISRPALYGAGRLEEARASLAKLLDSQPGFTIRRFREAMVFSPAML